MKNITLQSDSAMQTKKLGALLAEELRDGEIICLSGDLGSGKTTFTQGLLKGLKIKGPYTSPTFVVIKHYHGTWNVERGTKDALNAMRYALCDIYHIDAYRISAKDILNLGFADFAGKENSVTIIEWPEKIKRVIPTNSLWIHFKWIDEKRREITISSKKGL